jgi:hypothetical protein
MPPVLYDPEKLKAWRPIYPAVPAPPPPDAIPADMRRYHDAQAKWKDSTPLYRHINPRPETWIPRVIVDTDYNIPTAQEKNERRIEYLSILEDIKDEIPPEYYEKWYNYYSRPVQMDDGPDRTGGVEGYFPNMLTHPRFMEKDHSKYHALPRERMFPEAELLYKMQETHHVKANLDILDDDGMDYEERMREKRRTEWEMNQEDERIMREEVMRGTHWIDWDSDAEAMIDPFGTDSEPALKSVVWSPTVDNHADESAQSVVALADPLPEARGPAADIEPESSPPQRKTGVSPVEGNLGPIALAVGLGAALASGGYALWKVLVNFKHRAQSKKGNKHLNRKRFAREWSSDGKFRTKAMF